MRVRQMRLSDVGAVSAVGDACYPRRYWEPEGSFASKLAGFPSGCLVLEWGGTVSGYAVTFPYLEGRSFPLGGSYSPVSAPTCHYVHDVCVLPPLRGRGLAGRLALASFRCCSLPRRLVAVCGSEGFWSGLGFSALRRVRYGGAWATYMGMG